MNRYYRIYFQNENLFVQEISKIFNDEKKRYEYQFVRNIVSTPDLISILDCDSFDPILCENI